LDRDQEAYDYMKWWAVMDEESDVDYADLSVPYLHIKNANILEEPMKSWTGKHLNLAHASAVILIKLRILANLKDVQNATRAFSGVLPPEITDIIRGHLAGKVLKVRPHILRGGTEDISRLIKTLQAQALRLCTSIDKYNTFFWMFMMDETLVEGNTRPESYTFRSDKEAFMKIGFMAVAWASSPQAMSMIHTM
ncbi:hypothetical protein IMZ48_45750, partial [Candidatus Bathyarchaeota archaeon]|nr:hypothetical protein [Candidatus Bathyarchaeota archaeon]